MGTYSIGGLCSGYGGLEMAASELTGGTITWHAETDPHAAAVLQHHWPTVPNLGDITTTDWATVPPVDILCAGFPCQDISNAGRRTGIHGQRSGVWKHVAEAVRVLRPGIVLLENVAAIRTRGLDVVAGDLAQIGYDLRWACLRAGDPDVGAPHRRDRWFAIAAADPNLFGRDGWGGNLPQTQRGDEPAHRRNGTSAALSLLPTPKASDGPHGGPNQRDTQGRYYLPGMAVRLGSRGLALLPTPAASNSTFDSTGAHNSHGSYFLPGAAFRLNQQWIGHNGVDYGPAIRRWETITSRSAPTPTEPGMRGNRRLSPAFVEWMMGLPEGHVTGIDLPRAQQLKILGNGVIPQQARAAYIHLTVL